MTISIVTTIILQFSIASILNAASRSRTKVNKLCYKRPLKRNTFSNKLITQCCYFSPLHALISLKIQKITAPTYTYGDDYICPNGLPFDITSHDKSCTRVSKETKLTNTCIQQLSQFQKKKLRMNCLFGKKDIFGTGVKNWVKKGHSLNIKTYQRVIILLTLDAFSSEMMK